MGGARPWRGIAYYPCGNGARLVMRRVAAKSRAGLDELARRAERDGMQFDCWELLPHPAVEALITADTQQSSVG